MKSQVWVIGLWVMWKNISLNASDANFKTSVFNRTYSKTEQFCKEHVHTNITGYETMESFVASLEVPRKILLMVKAGQATDATIDSLSQYLSPWDIIIDGGNAHWENSIKREERLRQMGIHFIGSGISGWEEWARNGPSLMPWWDEEAYQQIQPIWEAIAAKDFSGNPCTTYIGASCSGNFVKMVHNGIEYAMMQSIAEIYDIYRKSWANPEEIHNVFIELNTWDLNSFLLDITKDIFTNKDPVNKNQYLIDVISDRAKSKGTGWWTVQSAIDLGVPVPSISAALMARQISAREWRFSVWEHINEISFEAKKPKIQEIWDALQLCFLGAYLQWLDCIMAADEEHKWGINIVEVIRIWQWGCIIRSNMLTKLESFIRPESQNVYDIGELLITSKEIVRDNNMALPVLHATIDYFRSIGQKKLPTNLIQAQRDYFWAHTFQRIDDNTDDSYHHQWS